MPQLLIPTASTARPVDAVMAVFRARLRNGALDAPHAARVGRPLIAEETRPAARPPRARRSPPDSGRGPAIAEATSPCGHPAASHRDRPLGRSLSVIRRTDDRQEHR
jgi:hypothetical protein